jgi:hypothetical protein
MTMTSQDRIDTRVPGIALIASAVVAMAVMAHHPTAGGGDFNTFARNVARVAAVSQAVHGTLIALVVVITWAVIAFAIRRGLNRPLVTLGLCTWVIGTACMIIAAIFNGFVVTDLALRALASPETRDMLRVALQLLNSGIHVIEVIGAIGMSAAVVLWSTELALDKGLTRQAGLLGVAAGAGLVIALATGMLGLDVRGMTLVLALWMAWFAAVGALMTMRRV